MNLPVHPTQVDTRFFVGNPPNQWPNFPPVPVPASIGNQYGFVLGLIAMYTQQNANANPARTFFSNLISRDNWQNQEAFDVVQMTYALVDFLLTVNPNDPNKGALVENAVGQTVQMMTAFFTSQYQNEMGRYLTPNLGEQLNNLLAQLQAVRGDIQKFYDHQRWQQQQQNTGGYNNGGMGFNNGMQNYGQVMNQSPLERMSRFSQPNSPTVSHSGFINRQPDPSLPLSGRFGKPAPVTPAPTFVDTSLIQPTFKTSSMSGGPGERANVQLQPRSTSPAGQDQVINGRVFKDLGGGPTAPAPTPAAAAPTNYPGWDAPVAGQPEFNVSDPSDPYREIIWRDGSILRPAAVSGWEKSRTTKNPYRKAYNPKTHVLFHLKTSDGVVHEVIEEKTESMERYVDHELQPDLRAAEIKRLAEKEGKSIVDWSKMTDLTPAEDKPYAVPVERSEEAATSEGGEEVAVETELHTISKVVSAHDVRSAETVIMVQYPELQTLSKETSVEFYCEAISPRLTSTDLHPAIKDLAQCSTFPELILKLQKAREQFVDDAPIWDEVEQRLTKSVNHVLNFGLAVDWTVDSFSQDAVELGRALYDEFGEDVATKYSEIAMYVIDQALCVAGSDASAEIAADSPEAAATELNMQHVLAFANRCSVTKIPYDFADLNVSFTGIAIVERAVLPELHKLIAAIFERTQDFPVTFSERLIKTADGVWLSLDQALLNEGSYLISRRTF